VRVAVARRDTGGNPEQQNATYDCMQAMHPLVSQAELEGSLERE
jgi:hypothetical protein